MAVIQEKHPRPTIPLSQIEWQRGPFSFSPVQCVAFASVLKTVYDIDEGRSLIAAGIPMSALRRRQAEEVLTDYFPGVNIAPEDLSRIFRVLIFPCSDGLTYRLPTFLSQNEPVRELLRVFSGLNYQAVIQEKLGDVIRLYESIATEESATDATEGSKKAVPFDRILPMLPEDQRRVVELRLATASQSEWRWNSVAVALEVTGAEARNTYRRAMRRVRKVQRLIEREDGSFLTAREMEVLQGRRRGLSNSQIAINLSMSRSTARRIAKGLIERGLLPIHPRDQRTIDNTGILEHTRRLDNMVKMLLQENPRLGNGEIADILSAPDRLGRRVYKDTVGESRKRLKL